MSIRTRWLQNYDRDTDALTDASLLSAAPTSTTGFVGSAADDQVCLLGVQVLCGFGCVAVVWVGSGGRLWPNASVFWVELRADGQVTLRGCAASSSGPMGCHWHGDSVVDAAPMEGF